MSSKLFVFQTDEKGKVTRVREISETGEYIDKVVYMDIVYKNGMDISCTITPLETKSANQDYAIYLRPGEDLPGGVKDSGITPGHNGPRPTPGS